MPWHAMLWIMSALGGIVAAGIAIFLPPIPARASGVTHGDHPPGRARGGFVLLLMIGVLDIGVRMGFLTFLPFLLKAQGASLSVIGGALTLVFVGGAAGKFACGWLGARFGVLAMVLLTEAGTALAILSVLILPLVPTLMVLLILGVMLNGTSSVLYGTVPDLVGSDRIERAFAIFYTGAREPSRQSFMECWVTQRERAGRLSRRLSRLSLYCRWRPCWPPVCPRIRSAVRKFGLNARRTSTLSWFVLGVLHGVIAESRYQMHDENDTPLGQLSR